MNDVVLHPEVNIISVFSGFGMLDTGVHIALEERGIRAKTVAYIERETSSASMLVERMDSKALDRAPIWDCIETFDGRPWRGIVDFLIASPPCQPYSSAGKKQGNEDERSHGEDGDGPLVHLARIIKECGPAVVYFENVSEWVVGGYFRRFGEELSAMGFEIEKPIFLRSEDTGAPHKRERVFILAYAQSGRNWGKFRNIRSSEQGSKRYMQPGTGIPSEGMAGSETAKQPVENPLRNRRRRRNDEHGHQDEGKAETQGLRSKLADTDSERHERNLSAGNSQAGRCAGELGSELGHTERTGLPITGEGEQRNTLQDAERGGAQLPFYPPARNDYRSWGIVAEVDAAKMPSIESRVKLVADGLAFSNSDLLRTSGNGVDPLVSAIAFDVLFTEAINKK